MRTKVVFFILILASSPALMGGKVDDALGKAAEVISKRDRVTGERSISMVPRQEQIAKADAEIEQGLVKLLDEQGVPYNEAIDHNVYAAVKEIFQRIHAVSHMRDEPWKILVIPEPSFNAFVNGGTYVVVHVGLLKGVEDEHELAAVIGHEIAHVAANHVFEQQSHTALAGLTKSKSVRREGFHKAYTHENEEEADKIGVLYSALAGYDPFAASRLWDRTFKQEGNRGAFMQDHPVNSERAAKARAIADKVNQYYTPGQQNPEFVALLEHNTLWQKRQETATGKGKGTLKLLDALLQGTLQHQKAKHEEKRQQQHVALVKALNQYMIPTQAQAVGPNTVRVMYEYRGSAFRFNRLVLAATVQHVDGSQMRVVQIYQNSQLQPGSYYVDFSDARLNAQALQGVVFEVDDVE